MNITNLRTKALYLVIVLVSVVAIGFGVNAYQSFNDSPKVVVEGNYIESTAPAAPVADQTVGAVTGPDLESLYFSVNGDNTYHITQTFRDATLTPISFLNPFGSTATATVELAKFMVTGAATTSYTMACGASATGSGAPSYSILSSDLIATSSVNYTVENGIASAAADGGFGGGSTQKIMLTPAKPYFVCTATESIAGGITNPANTFDGKATVRISKTR